MTSKSSNLSFGDFLVAVAVVLFIAFLVILFGGWILSMAWAEFMVPVFGLPGISIAQGMWAIAGFTVAGWAFRGLRGS